MLVHVSLAILLLLPLTQRRADELSKPNSRQLERPKRLRMPDISRYLESG